MTTTDHPIAGARDTTITAGFDPETVDMAAGMEQATAMVTGAVLSDLAEHDDRICVCAADLGRSARVHSFLDRHPDRYHQFGIAERSMIGAAAGMASVGQRPYVVGFACFLAILATENLKVDLCYADMPVRVLGTYSGVATGTYGTTHHATEDIGVLRALPNLTLLAPVDGPSLERALRATVEHEHPIYFRLGAGTEPEVYGGERARLLDDWRIGGSARLRDGGDVTIFATGTRVAAALEAAEQLAGEGVEAAVVDTYSLKPLDSAAVLDAARGGAPIVTVEEAGYVGGMGSTVASVVADHGLGVTLRRLSLPDAFSILGPAPELYAHYGIDAAGIRATVTDVVT